MFAITQDFPGRDSLSERGSGRVPCRAKPNARFILGAYPSEVRERRRGPPRVAVVGRSTAAAWLPPACPRRRRREGDAGFR